MGEAAVSLELNTKVGEQPALHLVHEPSEESSSSSFLRYLVLGLILLQILDGVLTGLGVFHLGSSAEGNPLLKYFMVHFGFIPTLIVAKSLSIIIICLLGQYAKKISWIEKAMAGVACLYVTMAVVPWTIILTSRLFFA